MGKSPKKRSAQASQLSQSLSEAIINSANDAIVGSNIDGTIISWNKAAENLFGFEESEAIDQPISLIIPEKYLDEEKEARQKLLDGEVVEHFEAHRLHKNSDDFCVSVNISPVKNHIGEVIAISHIMRDVTEQKRAELQGRENRFRVLFNTIIDSVVMIDSSGIIQMLNPAAVNMFGYTLAEVQGKNVSMLMPESFAREHDNYLSQYISTGERKVIGIGREVVGKRKDGSMFPMELAISEMEVNGERVFTGIVRDISDRIRIKHELIESKQFLDRVMDASLAGVYIYNIAEGKNDYINTYYTQITGFTLEDINSFTPEEFSQLYHPDDVANVQEHIQEVVMAEDDNLLEIEFRFRKKEGDWVWCLSRDAVFERDKKGKAIRFIGTIIDISERKRAESELRARENRIQALVDTIVDGIVVIDSKGNINTVNPAGLVLFGYGIDELKNQNIKLLMPDSYAREHDKFISRYLETGNKKIIGIGREVVGKRKDGSTFPMELAISEMEVNGERMFTGIVRDITQRKAYDSALHEAKEQAIAASKAKSEFLSLMSHELRTPLNAILGYSQLFLMDSKLPAEHLDTATEIHQAGNHLLNLISDLIDLSKIESGKIGINLESVPVGNIINDALNLIVPFARSHKVALINEVMVGDDISIQVDAVRFQQVIINLLSNSVKYNQPGGKVTVSCQKLGNTARVTVSDTGQGIPKGKQSRVFSAFDRLGRETGSIEGTGIGLVLTKRIVESMNGTVGFESIEGVGSSFWVELPLDDYSVALQQESEFTDSEIETIQNQSTALEGKIQILHIEDNPMNLRLMRQIFSRVDNVKLIDAQTAELGLELARANPPDLIIMDINLPGMNGYEAVKCFKSDANMNKIPVIAVSATVKKEDIDNAGANGFEAFLTKPIDVLEIMMLTERLTKP